MWPNLPHWKHRPSLLSFFLSVSDQVLETQEYVGESTSIGTVTTLQGRSITRTDEALERSSGMTLSRADLVLSVRMRSVQQRKATP